MNNPLTRNISAARGVMALALLITGSVNALATDRSRAVDVVSSISFDGKPASDMELENENGKSYLEIQFAGGEQPLMVDVTKPEKTLHALPAKPVENRTEIDGNLVTDRAATAEATTNKPANEEFALWDISKSKSPRLVVRFTNVSRVIEDKRGFIYVLHRDGLSVIRDKKKKSNWPDAGIFG